MSGDGRVADATGLSQAERYSMMPDLLGAPGSLLFVSAFFATEPSRTATVQVHYLGATMHLADRAFSSRVPAMHTAVLNRIEQLKVLWTAARRHVTFMVDVLFCRAVQRLKNNAVNLTKPSANPHMTVTAGIFRCGPQPAFAGHLKAGIKTNERVMCEHGTSIYFPGFNASGEAGSVHDSAGPKGIAR